MSRTRHHRDRRVRLRSCNSHWSPTVDTHAAACARLDLEAGLRFAADYPDGVVLGWLTWHGYYLHGADRELLAEWEAQALHRPGLHVSSEVRLERRVRQMHDRLQAAIREKNPGYPGISLRTHY